LRNLLSNFSIFLADIDCNQDSTGWVDLAGEQSKNASAQRENGTLCSFYNEGHGAKRSGQVFSALALPVI
jgi:hypothetical protein